MISNLILLISLMAPEFNINPKVVIAVIKTESAFKTRAVGPVGEIGLMQVRPKYSKYSQAQLFNPVINLTEGLRMLSNAKKRCRHQVDLTWIICYNLGVTGGSRVKYPKKFEYYKRIMEMLK